MGLNNIQLTSQTLVDLYRNSLCEDHSAISKDKEIKLAHEAPPVEQVAKQNPQIPIHIAFLGKNLRQLVIVVDYDNEVHLPEHQLNFIGNILKACKMNLADVAIVNVHQQQVNFATLRTQLNPLYLIIFGIEAPGLFPGNLPGNFRLTSHEEIQVFTAPALEKMNVDDEQGKLLKSKLWLCMKEMLQI